MFTFRTNKNIKFQIFLFFCKFFTVYGIFSTIQPTFYYLVYLFNIISCGFFGSANEKYRTPDGAYCNKLRARPMVENYRGSGFNRVFGSRFTYRAAMTGYQTVMSGTYVSIIHDITVKVIFPRRGPRLKIVTIVIAGSRPTLSITVVV